LHLIHSHNSGLQANIAVLLSPYITVRHYTCTKVLSVFTSRILATDLPQSHWHFKSHMKSSFHSLNFLPLFCSCQFRRLNSIQFLCCQAHILQAGISKLDSSLHLTTTVLLSLVLLNTSCNHCAWTPQKTPSSVVKEACLLIHYIIMDILLFRAFASMGTCLLNCCLAMGFTHHNMLLCYLHVTCLLILLLPYISNAY
jgi:hypothetical protein